MFRIPAVSAKPSLAEEGLGSCLSLLDVTNELRMLAILLVESDSVLHDSSNSSDGWMKTSGQNAFLESGMT